MLRRLTIQNVALIDSAELEFSEGLNVLTGETGAGKSVILDCIDFVLGAKADRSMIRHGKDACCVTAEFFVEDRAVMDVLFELDIEPEETLIISRRLTSDGRGSLKLNGNSVTAAMLRRVTSLLVDVHGQSEHFFLLKESNQLKLLDALAGEKVFAAKEKLKGLLSERKGILSELAKLGGDEGERVRRMDILRYQIDELTRAQLKEGEEEELKEKRERFRNAERIREGLAEARDYLLTDGGATDAARGAMRALHAAAKFGNEYGLLAERLENSLAELEDIAESVETLSGQLDTDEEEAALVETRLDEIRSLKKKYGGSVSSALGFLGEAEAELDLLVHSGERYDALTIQLSALDKTLYSACNTLTEERKRAASSFTKRVIAELATLNIPSARFEVEFGEYTFEDVGKATSEGLGSVRFLFSANAGEPLKELGKIISGGEMSRFMLAVKAQLSSMAGIGTYIFDEIDAGIGGKTAQVVAEKFAKIASKVQLIAVTHLARIAAFADSEFLIEKHEEGDATHTCIREVRGEARRAELARLIGGSVESEHVLAHAEELLAEAETYKKSL